jgi:DNA polymerase III epsilon subunit-like protein
MQRGPRRLLPDQVSYKLGALVTAFSLADSLPSGLVPHRATFDALVTARLFVRLATRHDGNSLSLGERRAQSQEATGMLRPFSSRESGLFARVDSPPHGLILRRRATLRGAVAGHAQPARRSRAPRTHHCIMMK